MPIKRRKKAIRSRFSKKAAVIGFGFAASEGFDQYIDLEQASLETGYSPDFLAMLINENKLRAVMLGQNWLTKKYWIEDYSKRSDAWLIQSEQIKRNFEAYRRAVLVFQSGDKPAAGNANGQTISGRMAMFMSEPAVLSYAFLCSLFVSGLFWGNTGQNLASEFDRQLARIGRAELVAGFQWQENSLDAAQLAASVSVAEAAAATANSMWQGAIFGTNNVFTEASDTVYAGTKELRDFLRYLVYGRTEVYVVSESPEVENVVFEKSVDALEQEITDYTASRFSDFRSEFGFTDEAQNPTVKRGTVIVPSSGKNQKLLTDLEKSFSDEVKIKPTDDNTGIIVPVFREKQGDEYLYIFVPVNENE